MLTSTLAIAGLLFACTPADEEVATYDGGSITESEFSQSLRAYYGESHLQQLIIEDIIESKYGEQVTDEDIEEAYLADAENSGGESSFEQILAESGYTPDTYKEALRFNLMLDIAMLEYVEITDEDIQAAYDDFEPEHQAAHILVESKSFAEELIERLDSGEDFHELAGDYSEDTGTSLHGGVLSFYDGELVPEFEDAFAELEAGSYTQEPVQTGFGYHIILAVEKGEKGSFEELRNVLEEEIIEHRMFDEGYNLEVISKLVEEAGVEIHSEDLENALAMYLDAPVVEDTDLDGGDFEVIDSDELTDEELERIQELIDEEESKEVEDED